jgi:hypothetical protein
MVTNMRICVTDRLIEMTNFFVLPKHRSVILPVSYNTIIFTAIQRFKYLQGK